MYSVASVINALKSNETLTVEDAEAIGCPSPKEDCRKNPDNCEKGNNQNCKQPITIYTQYKKLLILHFRYKISENNRNGFIRKDDSSLSRLIKHKYIDIHLLEPALKTEE
jgi:hypothetical protein